MGMAGSLLPSHDASVLKPVQLGSWTFTIEPLAALQTYILKADGSALAMHPNGYSLKELVARLAAYRAGAVSANRVQQQWDYILDCGGMTKSRTALDYFMGTNGWT